MRWILIDGLVTLHYNSYFFKDITHKPDPKKYKILKREENEKSTTKLMTKRNDLRKWCLPRQEQRVFGFGYSRNQEKIYKNRSCVYERERS